MPTYQIHDLHQRWIETGKKPVLIFSSQIELLPTPEPSPSFTPVREFIPVVTEAPVPTAVENINFFIPVVPQEVPTVQEAPPVVVLPVLAPTSPVVPVKTYTLPKWHLPRLQWTVSFRLQHFQLHWPKLPRVRWPRLPSLPTIRIHWPRPHFPPVFTWFTRFFQAVWQGFIGLPWKTALRVASLASYGGAIAALVLFATPIVVIEAPLRWQQLQDKIANLQLQSAEPTPVPTATPTPDPIINTAEDLFSVEVPRLKISSRIIPNVDTTNPEDYEASLKLGVAHAKGSGLPDDLTTNKTVYLFAHSTNNAFNIQRYNAQFYALKDTKPGDVVKVRYWGKDYWYKIEETKIVDADDVSYLAPQTDREILVLQTCYPPGTTWKRLMVIATPTEEPQEIALQ